MLIYICNMSIMSIFVLIIIGFCAGLLSGLVGVGGGILIIPLLILFLGFTQHQAQGTALFAMLPPIGILAAVNYYKQGFVRWEYAAIIALTFVVGGYFGSKLAVSLSDQIIKRCFGLVMLIAAIKLLISK